MADPEHDELVRLRDRFHQLEKTVAGHDYSLREVHRGLGGLRDDVRKLGKTVSEMNEAERIATAVTDALHARRRRDFTIGQKAFGAVVTVLLVVQPVDLIVHVLSHLGAHP